MSGYVGAREGNHCIESCPHQGSQFHYTVFLLCILEPALQVDGENGVGTGAPLIHLSLPHTPVV